MTVHKSVQQIEGLICRNFKLIADGSMILYVGDLASGSRISEWRLHIDAAWRLEGKDGHFMGKFDTLACDDCQEARERCIAHLQTLVGRRIICTDCISPLADLALHFEGGVMLRTFTYAMGSDAWELRHRSGRRFAFSHSAYREWIEDADRESTAQ